ncbi:5'-3' exonuclease H3TH domain-containing protein [Janthinobacterium sp. 17J80-10]|uniref:5'-3' exonuclease n=1 Tax=Janthinobacterium sp. 17J80-10 TaxID=2497863 RepID=UPI0010056DC4|nr:5'-3' exonuclease H3TH domain-containing protein [Janthinobacterium sp. 17J80-10]QAU33065.1 5'-3' exonuclease [Janthinobacterium sp. 17J80-10]
MAKLLVIDGMHIVRRIYEANDEVAPADKAQAALRHALPSFRRLLATHQPTHVLGAFDHGGHASHTWRHALHSGYRANHAPPPEELRERLPAFFEQLRAIGMVIVSVPEVAAKDVIGTAVLRWLQESRGEAVIASTDKDLHCLIAQGALLWDHFKQEWHDREWVEHKFGVLPQLLPELLALAGEPSDNVPGISKVGAKTAAKLLQNYGSLEQVLAGAGILMNPLGERLRKERGQLELSRKLVALKTDVRLGVSWHVLRYPLP